MQNLVRYIFQCLIGTKVIVMSFALSNDDVLLLSCEKDIDFDKLSFKVLKIIEPLKKSLAKTF